MACLTSEWGYISSGSSVPRSSRQQRPGPRLTHVRSDGSQGLPNAFVRQAGGKKHWGWHRCSGKSPRNRAVSKLSRSDDTLNHRANAVQACLSRAPFTGSSIGEIPY